MQSIKTAELIGTRLGMVVGVGPGIGVLNFGGDRRRGRGSFGGGKSGTFHCNQWDCVRGDDAAVPKLLWVFSCYIDKAHRALIFTIVQLSCHYHGHGESKLERLTLYTLVSGLYTIVFTSPKLS